MSRVPLHDTPILGMATRPPVSETTKYGAGTSFWIEYPSGLIDLSRSNDTALSGSTQECPQPSPEQLDIPVEHNRTIRVDRKSSAIVIIDMQKSVVQILTCAPRTLMLA